MFQVWQGGMLLCTEDSPAGVASIIAYMSASQSSPVDMM